MLTRVRGAFPLPDALAGARFVRALLPFLRQPVSQAEARVRLRLQLDRRAEDFLALAERVIYANPANPYRQLLALAGCELGDLRALIQQEGLEGGLRHLYQRGVYLTLDEFKGRMPVVRGSASVSLSPENLVNPTSAVPILMATSGSRGARGSVPVDLAFVRESAGVRSLLLGARGGADWVIGVWMVPGGAGLYYMLAYAGMGMYPARWFTMQNTGGGLPWRYRGSTYALLAAGRLVGKRFPGPEYVPADAPLPIAAWMAECLRRGTTPCVASFPSAVGRLCQVAASAGIELAGARFEVAGEPFTDAIKATIQGVGAEAVPIYGSMEVGAVAYGCLSPATADDSHVLRNMHALVQPGPSDPRPSLPPSALLVTSLRPSAPFLLLNTSLGDQAELDSRACGCPLHSLGLPNHVRTIRSFEKLTAGGVTFFDTEVVPILEAELPARFGGGPRDYQLVEEAGADGGSRLSLLVRPEVGPLDEAKLAATFLTLLGRGSSTSRIMELHWRQEGLLRVERRAPLSTASGKILHLVQRPPSHSGKSASR